MQLGSPWLSHILLVDWLLLSGGGFLQAPCRGPRGPLANDVTVSCCPPAGCEGHWDKKAPSVPIASSTLPQSVLTDQVTSAFECEARASGPLSAAGLSRGSDEQLRLTRKYKDLC